MIVFVSLNVMLNLFVLVIECNSISPINESACYDAEQTSSALRKLSRLLLVIGVQMREK